MVVKLYISGISGNKEVKKKQQRVQMILDSKQITYEAIDITEPGKEKDKEFMQQFGKVRESLGKYPLPPQIFNDESFCGDYDDFDLANEVDELEKFLHIETKDLENGSKVNGVQEEFIDTEKPNEDNVNHEEEPKVNGTENCIAAPETSSNEVKNDEIEAEKEDSGDVNPTLVNESDDAQTEETMKIDVEDQNINVNENENENIVETEEVEEEDASEEEIN